MSKVLLCGQHSEGFRGLFIVGLDLVRELVNLVLHCVQLFEDRCSIGCTESGHIQLWEAMVVVEQELRI